MPAPGQLVLVVNAGSSSVKVRLLDADDAVVERADLGPLTGSESLQVLADALAALPTPGLVGHRVVHGGERFRDSVVVDDAVQGALGDLSSLAPLHNPPAVAAVGLARSVLPVPHVACFDTAFHRHLPAEAATFAVPEEWRLTWGLRRYGFHGLSHSYASRRAAELVGEPLQSLRLVVCHLGAGASLCAVAAGRSVDTTMGFTPLDGLVMATRSGSVDPGAVLWLQQQAGLPAGDVQDALERRSGLLGLSGLSGNPTELYAAADGGDGRARLALDVYLHRLCGLVAAMATAAGGLDALVFTGGVGEHCHRLRDEAVGRLAWLGLRTDGPSDVGGDDAVVTAAGQRPAICVVHAREDIEIAHQARRLVGPGR